MEVEIKEMPGLRVGTIRHIGPYPGIGATFQRLARILGTGCLDLQPGMPVLAVHHDDPRTTPPEELRSDAAVVLADGTPVPEGLVERRVPAGRYASALHVGPYEGLGEAWTRFVGEALPGSGFRSGTGASLEIYRNHPEEVSKEELATELLIPIA